jgi:hypothetical protein
MVVGCMMTVDGGRTTLLSASGSFLKIALCKKITPDFTFSIL